VSEEALAPQEFRVSEKRIERYIPRQSVILSASSDLKT
jgi:hypothetical protein